METDIKTNPEVQTQAPASQPATVQPAAQGPAQAGQVMQTGRFSRDGQGGQGGRDFKKNSRRPARRESRVKPEFDQKIIDIRRVARVVTGGRRFSFSVAIVAGNRKGSVGVGLGKAGDTSLAIEKAFNSARKNLVTIQLTGAMSIPHEVTSKYASSRVTLMPAPDRGMIAGSSARIVLELAGVKDVGAKVRSGSKNKLNIARATIVALQMLSKPKAPRVKVANTNTETKAEAK